MKFLCITCNYESNDKSNYNRHLNSKAHLRKILVNSKKRLSEFQCPKCDKIFKSAPGLSRHKNNYCKLPNDINNKLNEKQKEIEIMKRELEIVNIKKELEVENIKKDLEIEYGKKLLEKSETEIKELKQYIKNTKPTTYNISVKKMIQQSYPDAPHLTMLKNYAIIHESKDIDFTEDLIKNHKLNRLNSYLGDIIIKYYKKEDPKTQSLWSTDSSRLKYIIKELLASKKSNWSEDDKGIKINKYVIKPLLKYILEYINDKIDRLHDIIEDHDTNATKAVDLNQIQIELNDIREQIKNGQLKDAINKYIAPNFKLEDKLIAV